MAANIGNLDDHAPGDRLPKMVEACLSIASMSGLAEILQAVADEARSITGAQFAAIKSQDDSGLPMGLVTSGARPGGKPPATATSANAATESQSQPEYGSGALGPQPFTEPQSGADTEDLFEFSPQATPQARTGLEIPLTHRGQSFGFIRLMGKNRGGEFAAEDEESLAMLSSIASLAISNARSYWTGRRDKADLEAIMDTAPMGVMVFDAETGALVSTNQEVNRLVADLHVPGLSVDKILGALKYRRADGREISLEEIPLVQILSSGETVRAEEIDLQIPGRPAITALLNATPIRSEDNRVVSVVVTLQDLKPQEDIRRIHADFLGTLGHELQTPLAAIKGSAVTLLGASPTLDPHETRQFYRIIDQQTDRMRDLISNLLDLSCLEAGILPIAPQPSEVADILDTAKYIFLGRTDKRDIVMDLGPNLPLVWADKQRLAQVIVNLLFIASKYYAESSAIRITAQQKGACVEITVENEDAGQSAEGLFQWLGYPSAAEGDQGHSLSLALCKGIVESHGGRIWADADAQGRGARFTFTLPIAVSGRDEVKVGPTRESENSTPESTVGVSILAIDRDPQTLQYINNALEKAGCKPVATSNPGEVEQILESVQPQLVLLDLGLPGADGLELIERIPKSLNVPVIFLSDRSRGEDIARAFEMGGDDYIVKPFLAVELVSRIKAALRKRAAYDQANPIAPYQVGDLTIDYAEHSVSIAGQPVQLTAKEYKLLFEFSISAGRVLTHDQLLRRVWGSDYSGDARILRSFVKNLRRKLGDTANRPRYIHTEPRVGYRMAKPDP